MSCHRLPGIKKIQIVRCSDLPKGLMLHSICGCEVAISAPSESIEFSGRPILSWEGSKVNGKNQEKSVLQFSTVHRLPEGERIAFVVTIPDGHQYLVGTYEPNYPEITYEETTGNPGSDAAVRTYKIKHIAQKSVLPCVL